MASAKTHFFLKFSLFVTLFVSGAQSANILIQFPVATKSETHLLTPIAKSLLERGHHVTLVTPATSSIKHRNFTEIVPVRPFDIGDFGPLTVLDFRRHKDNPLPMLFMDPSFAYDFCHETYQNKDFIKHVLEKESFDLALTTMSCSECWLGLFHKLKAPYIILSSMPFTKEVFELTGLRLPLSFVPNPFFDLMDKMTFYDKLVNTVTSWGLYLFSHHRDQLRGEKIYRKYLGEELPSVKEIRKNVSMIFSNTHFSTNFPRPLMPDAVEIGGVHIQPTKPLPKDLEEFCSGGDNGFIFFSLGTVFQEKTCPEELKQVFINVFSKLKIRVLWKWSGEIKGLPENVKVSKWLPQADLLAHPKLKLFISHGGLLSTQEATYHGVPVLGLPIFVDQDVNARNAENRGYGLKLELLDLTEEKLEAAIKRVLNEKSFAENAKLASQIFKDQMETPLERAIYWMEYVIKYNGAPQLRSTARNLSYFQYHLYDVQLFFLAIIGTVLVIVWKIISKCLGFYDEVIVRKKKDGRNGKSVKFAKKLQ